MRMLLFRGGWPTWSSCMNSSAIRTPAATAHARVLATPGKASTRSKAPRGPAAQDDKILLSVERPQTLPTSFDRALQQGVALNPTCSLCRRTRELWESHTHTHTHGRSLPSRPCDRANTPPGVRARVRANLSPFMRAVTDVDRNSSPTQRDLSSNEGSQAPSQTTLSSWIHRDANAPLPIMR